MSIVDRILAGESTWEEVWEHNIGISKERAEKERNNKHDPKDCKRAYCAHGNPRRVEEQERHTAKLEKELAFIKRGWVPNTNS